MVLGVLAFSLVAMQDLRQALTLGSLPIGLGLWTPAVILEVFFALGVFGGPVGWAQG